VERRGGEVKADFEEKSFEVAANFELGLLGSAVDFWAPGQVLEGVLGFDFMVQLEGNVDEVNDLIGAAIPAGLFWKQYFGNPASADSAPDWASLFLQYKRPDRMLRRRGKFLGLFQGEYYRFDLDRDQHASLVGFREASQNQAFVCYAAPRFHTSDDLKFYRQHRLVLERTAFIEVGLVEDHEYGAYDEIEAFLCSEPEEVLLLGLPGLIGALRRTDRVQDDSVGGALLRHLRTLADAATVPADAGTEQREPLDLRTIVRSILRFAWANDATWLICGFNR
jgi:hypothetical protein